MQQIGGAPGTRAHSPGSPEPDGPPRPNIGDSGGQGRHSVAADRSGPTAFLVPGRLPPADESVGGYRHVGPYAAVAIRTTGMTPARDRIVELAVARLDPRGRPVDEWSTLLDPAPDGPGPLLLHGLIAPDVAGAPTFARIGRALLARLEGHVVAAHRADLVSDFLAAEFRRAALVPPSFPALDTFRLVQAAHPTPNPRLSTLAAHLAVGTGLMTDGTAAGEARLVAALAIRILSRHGTHLVHELEPPPMRSDAGAVDADVLPRRRRPAAPIGDAWLVDLLARTRMGAREAHDPCVAWYVETLVDLLAQGRVVAEEVRSLTGLVARAGYSANDIRDMNGHLLESLRQAAFTEPRLDPPRVRHLRAAAASIGVPTYFDDLVPPAPPPAPALGTGTFSRPVRKPPPAPPPRRTPRCGHCLAPGHYTSTCPRRTRRYRPGPVPPVDPVDPIRPI